jgi:hypothetical protein
MGRDDEKERPLQQEDPEEADPPVALGTVLLAEGAVTGVLDLASLAISQNGSSRCSGLETAASDLVEGAREVAGPEPRRPRA